MFFFGIYFYYGIRVCIPGLQGANSSANGEARLRLRCGRPTDEGLLSFGTTRLYSCAAVTTTTTTTAAVTCHPRWPVKAFSYSYSSPQRALSYRLYDHPTLALLSYSHPFGVNTGRIFAGIMNKQNHWIFAKASTDWWKRKQKNCLSG